MTQSTSVEQTLHDPMKQTQPQLGVWRQEFQHSSGGPQLTMSPRTNRMLCNTDKTTTALLWSQQRQTAMDRVCCWKNCSSSTKNSETLCILAVLCWEQPQDGGSSPQVKKQLYVLVCTPLLVLEQKQ